MASRSTRQLVLIAVATVTAILLVRLAGTAFSLYAISGPGHPHFTRLAWIELGTELALLACAVAAAWWILRQERQFEQKRVRETHLAEVGVLASGLAHEVRNYLNAMHTNIALVRKAVASDTIDTDRCEQRIRRLEETANSFQELLEDFLTFARPLEDRLEAVDVGELVREVSDFVGLDMEQAGVVLRIDIDPQVLKVRADRSKLKRAILNLLVNARQAMPEGGSVSVHVISSPDFVTIEISDEGCGIPEEDRLRLFESFFSTKSEGVGLGLAIVKRTIEDLSGSITYETTVGKGTTFRITLPVTRGSSLNLTSPVPANEK